jgi:nitroreductase
LKPKGDEMKPINMAIVSVFLLAIEIGTAIGAPLEITVSQRYSDRSYTDEPITSQQLLTALNAAYGYSGANRVVPKIGDDYSLTVFLVNSTGSYVYSPETNSISVWDMAVSMETIIPTLTQSWQHDANVILVIVWNMTIMNNAYFAETEAGCLVQNFYLAAIELGIGTCCASLADADALRVYLKLPTYMMPLANMITGFPLSQYPAANPDYNRMTGNLPQAQIGEKSFADAISNMQYAQVWSTQALSLQEQSQLLWAAYGYSSTGHRTTPSWGGWYPLIVYMSNVTGTFRYLPESHSLSVVQAGDRRSAIAIACGNQVWAADAPAIFLVAYNSTVNSFYDEPGWYDYQVEIDAGCVVQQILLESSVLNLSSSVVSKGFESWNGSSAQTLRGSINVSSSIVPLYILPVGHAETDIPEFPSWVILPLFITVMMLLAFTAFRKRNRSPAKYVTVSLK